MKLNTKPLKLGLDDGGGGGGLVDPCKAWVPPPSIYIKEKKIRNRKKKEQQKLFLMKLNTKPLKFKCRLADGEGGQAGRPMQGMGNFYPSQLIKWKLAFDNVHFG
jgi:hypothetical protein